MTITAANSFLAFSSILTFVSTADCPNGQEYSATQVRCVNCPLGAYRNTIDADDDYRCKQCERGTTTAGTGSSNCPVGKSINVYVIYYMMKNKMDSWNPLPNI